MEAGKAGKVLGCAVPIPPASVPGNEGCRIFVKFATADEANKCKGMMDGRTFDESLVKAVCCTDTDFLRAQAGDWFVPVTPTAGLPMAGLPGMIPRPMAPAGLPAGLPGGLPAGLTLPPGFSLAGQLPGAQ